MIINKNEIEIFSGNGFDILNPTEESIDINDIAHSLSLLCRFNGQCKEFYSVAQHSVVCYVTSTAEYDYGDDVKINRDHDLWCLLHDSAEAYIGDLVRPVKRLVGLEKFAEIEENIMKVIARRYNLPWPMPAIVKEIDNRVLYTEKRDIMKSDNDWGWSVPYVNNIIVPWKSDSAKDAFLTAFRSLV